MKVRPLFVLPDLEAGGAQRVFLTIIRQLNRDRFDPQLVIVSSRGPLKHELPEDIPIYELNSKVRYMLPKLFRLCWKIIPDVAISTLGHMNLGLAFGKKFLPSNTRIVIREANTVSIRLKHTMHPRAYKFLYRRLYPQADAIVCNSDFMRRDLKRFLGVSGENILVVPNPVDVQRIRRAARLGENPFPSKGCQIVSVGRLHFQKGFDLLLKALGVALQSYEGLQLTIVGDGRERDRLTAMAGDLGLLEHVTFTGYRENPYPTVANADLFVSSSRWEGSPNVVLESLACGTPVLAFDCPGGTGEIIDPDVNGWLTPPEDWEGMGHAMAELCRTRAWHTLPTSDLLPERFRCEHVVQAFERVLSTPLDP